MRKNKTYEQQKKFYDKNNDYESLGALFFEWLTSGYMTAKQIKMYTEKEQRNARSTSLKTCFTL